MRATSVFIVEIELHVWRFFICCLDALRDQCSLARQAYLLMLIGKIECTNKSGEVGGIFNWEPSK